MNYKMIHIPIEQVIEKIKTDTHLSEAEIREQINKKLQSLDGLVSEEGAAYIIASELGVKLFPEVRAGETLKIKNILSGMQNVDVVGKVTRTFEPVTFNRDNQDKKVGSFMIGDDTGHTRVVLWDARAEWITEGKIKPGTILKIKSGYVKENKYSGLEVHLGQRSSLILNPADVAINVIAEEAKSPVKMRKVTELVAGERARVLGTVVQVFEPTFYPSCPQCSKKVTIGPTGAICAEHKTVTPTYSMIINLIIDDGTDSLRAVAFRNRAEKLIGMSAQEISDAIAKAGNEALADKIEINFIGKTIEVIGKVVNNANFNRLELQIEESNLNPDPINIAKDLLRQRE